MHIAMFQRSRRWIGAINLYRFRNVVAPRSWKLSKSGATIATSPVSRDAKSNNLAVHWTLFGILTVFSVLFYWSKKKTWPFTSESESKRQNILTKAIARALPAVVYITNYRVVELN